MHTNNNSISDGIAQSYADGKLSGWTLKNYEDFLRRRPDQVKLLRAKGINIKVPYNMARRSFKNAEVPLYMPTSLLPSNFARMNPSIKNQMHTGVSTTPFNASFLSENMQSMKRGGPFLKRAIAKSWRGTGSKNARLQIQQYNNSLANALKQGADVLEVGKKGSRYKDPHYSINSLNNGWDEVNAQYGGLDAPLDLKTRYRKQMSDATRKLLAERMNHFRRPKGLKKEEWGEKLAKLREEWTQRKNQAP